MKSELLEIITKSAQETQKAAKILAKEILSRSEDHKALVIGLQGELGSGKTTFVQGLAKGLGIKSSITSPTFVILKKYKIPVSPAGRRATKYQLRTTNLYHIDCYRIKSKDLLDLDFKEIMKQSQNIIIIEWAERVKNTLPADTLWIRFDYLDKNKRKIIINLKN